MVFGRRISSLGWQPFTALRRAAGLGWVQPMVFCHMSSPFSLPCHSSLLCTIKLKKAHKTLVFWVRDYLSSSKGFWRHVPIKLSREVWPCKPECIKEFQNPASCTGDSVHIEYVTFHVWREIFSIGEISHQAEEKFQLIFVKTVQHLAEFRDSLYKQNLTELQASVPLFPQSQCLTPVCFGLLVHCLQLYYSL